MWCQFCGQDVPGLVTADDGKHRCPRCSEVLTSPAPSLAVPAGALIAQIKPVGVDLGELGVATDAAPHSPPVCGGWEIDEELRHIERVLRIGKHSAALKPVAGDKTSVFRVDAAHHVPGPRHPQPIRQPLPSPRRARSDWPILAWISLSFGMTVLVCGAVLLGWSVTSGRQDLWTTGVPITLSGAAGLLLGLILQLDRLWHDNRQAADRLERLDVQLNDLKTAASLLGTAQTSPATAFYAHMAEGANPKLLLADLKSQLDLLSAKFGIGD